MEGCKTIVVLDYSRSSMSIFYVPENWDDGNTEEYLTEQGFNLNNIAWMIGKKIAVFIGENENFGAYL